MSNYDGFRGWLNYIRDYEDNKDLLGDNLKEKELKNEIEILEKNSEEKDHLLFLRNQRIDVLTTKCKNYSRRNDELRSILNTTMKENDKLQEKLQEKELLRRKNASAIGGLKAKINELKSELERANQKIAWLKNNQKAPTKEEIIAYETRMKEVEKRIKNK